MQQMNWVRTLLGGVAAGLVINVSESVLNNFVLKADWAAAMQALGKSSQVTGLQMAGFAIWGFLLGISAVWLYAAISPRYGQGWRVAGCAGLATWWLVYALSSAGALIFDIFPPRLMLISVAWGLPEIVLATMAGAWFYREKAEAPPQPVAKAA